MKRREFLLGFAPALAALSGSARAQAVAKRPLVGFIVPGTPKSHGKWLAAFTKHLEELGWVDGTSVTLEIRYAAGNASRYEELGAELAGLHADVIASSISQPVEGIRRVAPNTPIVLLMPTGTKLISSLAHPGGTVTGLSMLGPELGGKRFEILRALVPSLKTLAVLGVEGDEKRKPETSIVSQAAQKVGVEIKPLVVARIDDIDPAIRSVTGTADALYIIIDPLFSVHQVEMNKQALEAHLPTITGLRDYVVSGSLAAYGVSFEDLFRRAADYVDKILRGAAPGDLPVEQPIKFDLVLNAKTADALGLTIPPTLLASATEIIE
jgi:putative ABC transport system substrate-binding protein